MRESDDMTVPCGSGYINIRVGAIIMKEGRFLMVGNGTTDYLYSVGGRVKFGETAEEAVIREVMEETGTKLEIERLGFVHENYFIGDSPDKLGKPIYELSFFFYMKVPEGWEPESGSFTEAGEKEFLRWVTAETETNMYPAFFRTELKHPEPGVKHIVTDERFTLGSKVTVTVDRPLGSAHPDHPDMIYPVNYGYVRGVPSPDGEEQDAYILGADEPVSEFTGMLIAIIHRLDDVEDKWVVAPYGMHFTEEEIRRRTEFQEQYFKSEILM